MSTQLSLLAFPSQKQIEFTPSTILQQAASLVSTRLLAICYAYCLLEAVTQSTTSEGLAYIQDTALLNNLIITNHYQSLTITFTTRVFAIENSISFTLCLQKQTLNVQTIPICSHIMNQYRSFIQSYQSSESSEDLLAHIIDLHPNIQHTNRFANTETKDKDHNKYSKLKRTQEYGPKNKEKKRRYKRMDNSQLSKLEACFKSNRFDKCELSKEFGISETTIVRFIRQFHLHGMLFPRSKSKKKNMNQLWESDSWGINQIVEETLMNKQTIRYLRQDINSNIKKVDVSLIAKNS